ncbi:unnamed protein product [Bursaphelenchus xylophilus]|uniref:non-specific serine/threonine protein kinase n=1 Tax=Bursaphelenchus xylophilus TaxID=6326 RepID=A0A1I7SEI1_BURXY|nr:unnamed protein product [Bursaphelenchus xylophilus]CAG9113512.1 unnamed protein product [Bursaphelenchus xylophilus]
MGSEVKLDKNAEIFPGKSCENGVDVDDEESAEPTEPDQSYPYRQNEEIHSQGAEARLYKCIFLGKPAIQKIRFSKKYRHPELDKRLTRERLRNEMKSIIRCKEIGIQVPSIYFLDTEKNAIIFEEIPGCSIKDFLAEADDSEESRSQILEIGEAVGKAIAKLHQNNIAHGDLTTGNLMLRNRDPKSVVLLDFGLATFKTTPEDFGVDLYVLERAIRTTHVHMEYFTDKIFESYRNSGWKGAKSAIDKLSEVRMRGRKREMVG